MKLIDYLKSEEISDDAFAASLQVSVFAVRKWMYRERVPRPAVMQRIHTITDGRVTFSDWYEAPNQVAPSEVAA